MTPFFALAFLLLGTVVSGRATNNDRPDYIHCQNNLECAAGECCVISPMRYSVPQCRSMQEEGSTCRPGSATSMNLTVGYPDGSQVYLNEVHYIMCPCADGLTCHAKEGVCRDVGAKHDENQLFDDDKLAD